MCTTFSKENNKQVANKIVSGNSAQMVYDPASIGTEFTIAL